ncbi:aldo/keto reductase [Paenibacillus sp. GCM10027626]|uniref:aldo/keto reductase n=1 Tax=Paenibacillus sp. GCM10027626 TaxID=3273411 RepID=UPI0036261EEA
MQEQQFGNLKISGMTLGTVQLGMTYGIANKSGIPDESASSAMLQAALDHGITCFDTASAYGESEKVLGSFFARKSSPPVIVSKIRLEVGADTSAAEVEAQMRRFAEGSLSQLQVKQVPIMMLHNPDVIRFHANTVMRVLESLIAEGVIGKAGVSLGANIDEHMRDLWPIVEHDLFEAIQIPINILDHRLLYNEGLAKLQQQGKIVFARSVFLQGLLFMEDDELPLYLQEAKEPLAILRKLSQTYDMSIAQMAFSFVRDMPEIHSLVVGAETVGQLEENVSLMQGPALSEELRMDILQALRHTPEQVVNTVLWG